MAIRIVFRLSIGGSDELHKAIEIYSPKLPLSLNSLVKLNGNRCEGLSRSSLEPRAATGAA